VREGFAEDAATALHSLSTGSTLTRVSARPSSTPTAAQLPWRRSLESSGRLLVVLLAAIFVATATLLGGMTWRTLQRLQRIETRVESADRVRSIALDLEKLVLDALAAEVPVDPARLQAVRNRLQAAILAPNFLAPATAERLHRIW
jgi:hypothetical protein